MYNKIVIKKIIKGGFRVSGKRKIFIYGGIIGLIGAILMKFGNPGNKIGRAHV